MAEQPLREIVDALRDRIHAELDAQSQALTAKYHAAVAEARREAAQAAEADAETRWAARVEAVRVEWGARLQSEVSAARAEAEKRLVAESMRVRAEAEQAVASERLRAEAAVQEERRRAEEHLEQTLAAIEAERRQLEAMETPRLPAERPDPDGALDGVRAIEDARTLSEVLAALVRASAATGARAALFVVNGSHLDEWSVGGVQPLSNGGLDIDSADAGVLSAAARTGTTVPAADGDPRRHVPSFARPGSPARAAAVPLIIGGQVVAVLYADDANPRGDSTSSAWLPTVELLGRHAAACLAHLTAIRALQLVQGNGPPEDFHESSSDDQGARRYAKLLVSEIKLYNESAVRTGREKRDLMQRLGGEIERARRLYEERVSPAISGRGAYFHDELVHTLAGGDPALLG